MSTDKVIEILEIVLPVIATALAAKYVNANSPHWTAWSGRLGRIVGLVVVLADCLRNPSKIKDEVFKREG